MGLAKFRKLIVALAVPIIAFGLQQAGISFDNAAIQGFVVAALTAFGVFGAPNEA